MSADRTELAAAIFAAAAARALDEASRQSDRTKRLDDLVLRSFEAADRFLAEVRRGHDQAAAAMLRSVAAHAALPPVAVKRAKGSK